MLVCLKSLSLINECSLPTRDPFSCYITIQVTHVIVSCVQGHGVFQQALEAYCRSCTLSDSEQGDDLPGLLQNWGVGLYDMSKHFKSDLAGRSSLLQQSAAKLQSSMDFNRGDMEPMTALGDVLCDLAECAEGGAAGLQPSAPEIGPSETLTTAAALYQQAIDQGYLAALNISRTNADALVGVAEANASLARLALRAEGGATAAGRLLQSRQAYNSALQKPTALGSFRERCDVRYNFACVCALSGEFALAQELLTFLAMCGGLSAADAAADGDLQQLHPEAWFQQILQGLGNQAPT